MNWAIRWKYEGADVNLNLPTVFVSMIKLTRLNNSTVYVNPDLIKSLEETPDTIISLINGDHFLVREKAEEVIDKILVYRVRIIHLAEQWSDAGSTA